MDVQLELQPADPAILAQLMGDSDVPKGHEVEIGDQVRLRYLGKVRPRGEAEVIALIISFSAGISSSLIANVLYDYLKSKKIEVKITFVDRNRRRIPADITSPEDTVEVLENIIRAKGKSNK
jgi:hypothetical protein